MSTKVFINLPVANLDRSKEFFTAIGFAVNPQFTDDMAACIVISPHIYAMLLTRQRFQEFTSKPVADAHAATEVLTALSMESKEAVHDIMEKALAAGATEARPPEDHGFMYGRSFHDLDGHIWELFWMDAGFAQPG
jgi:uncharacterized protein